ncbi:hypothetical protein [Leptospira vanthielii]|uniref:DUF2846 domain-containing protein n=1 Tax=Leptospira vanthielii TaxID=293085 RepID=A0ABY2NRA4_9LEPT|nr:hypothetical protein [Leptospira vanthielii]TGM59080.1 hypothetical protein EHQ95_05005 [Leptospira vanthielii]
MNSKYKISYFTIFIFFNILLGFTMQCAEKKSFVKLVSKENNTGLLYLIRPEHPALSLWNYECLLSRYPDKFSSRIQPNPIYKIELQNASLGYLRLQEGTYRLDVVGKPDATKVFQIKKGEEKYIELKIFSETKISRSELTFREIDRESTLSEVLSVPVFVEHQFLSVQMPIE